jgi:hypothetical protein
LSLLAQALFAATSGDGDGPGAALALGVPAAVAVVGFFVTYAYSLRLAKRKDRLERINRQLSDLYGPLLSLSSASDAAWKAFRRRWRPDVGSYWADPEPTEDERVAWRTWMAAVFMPLNRRMRDVVVESSDLLEETVIPACLMDLCEHVATYEAVIAQWDQKNYTEHTADINFPALAVYEYSEASFARLKTEQQRLLGSSKDA